MRRISRAGMPAAARLLARVGPLCLLIVGCANGDFGRIKPSLVHDDIHAWMGPAAAANAGERPSQFALTDDERLLRDLGYPLIEPPYRRQQWDSILHEYGLTQVARQDWVYYDRTAYGVRLFGSGYRSASARYAQLVEDIRNDSTRIGPFLRAAARVADMDEKRARSLAYVSALTVDEQQNALRRNRENALIIAWVCRSLAARVESFQYALERLVIATPSPAALEGERTLTQLRARVGACFAPPPHLLPPDLRTVRPVGHVSKG